MGEKCTGQHGRFWCPDCAQILRWENNGRNPRRTVPKMKHATTGVLT